MSSPKSTNPYRIVVNPRKGSHEPRITISRRPDGQFICRPEVSIGSWLFGSNLHLPSLDDLPYFFDSLDDYVAERTGLILDSRTARVARIDLTTDFKLDPQTILGLIDSYRHFRFPKRNTHLINGSTVNFDSKGRVLSQRTVLYSKYHELLARKAEKDELEMAKGILRLEHQFRTNQSVRELSLSQGFANHRAQTIMSEEIYSVVMGKIIRRLGIDEAVKQDPGKIKNMFRGLGNLRAGRVMAHLALERVLGKEYYLDAEFNTSDRMAKQRTEKAASFGLIRLE